MADAGPAAGFGHLARSSAVVISLRTRGFEVKCYGLGAERRVDFDGVSWDPAAVGGLQTGPEICDLLLLDSYVRNIGDLTSTVPLLASFCDAAGDETATKAALVIAPAFESGPTDGWLCGLRYSCLRPVYWGLTPRPVSPQVRRILVTTGGSDPQGVSRWLVELAKQAAPAAKVHRVRGPQCEPLAIEGVIELDAPTDLRSELREADVALCLGGQTALEAASIGVPTVALAVVDNQQRIVERLKAVGAIASGRSDGELRHAISEVVSSSEYRQALSESARAAIDGFGALRTAAAIDELIASSVER